MNEAAVMLIIESGLILSVSRRNDTSKIGLAGGKVEKNETPKQAAIRETFEETGIKVLECVEIFRRVEPAHGPGGINFNAYCFYAISWEGMPLTHTDEGRVAWTTAEDLCGPHGAFAKYNTDTLKVFKTLYPEVELITKVQLNERFS